MTAYTAEYFLLGSKQLIKAFLEAAYSAEKISIIHNNLTTSSANHDFGIHYGT